jgi:hypothetical protein
MFAEDPTNDVRECQVLGIDGFARLFVAAMVAGNARVGDRDPGGAIA